MFRSMGWQELLIVGFILLTWLVPGILGAIAFFRIAKRAGYEDGTSVWWALGYAVGGWIAVVALGFTQWPRESLLAQLPPPPPQSTAIPGTTAE